MRLALFVTAAAVAAALSLATPLSAAPPPGEVPLWEKGAPGTEGRKNTEEHKDGLVFKTFQPSLTPYLPAPRKRTGAAVIVCPGGGYNVLEMEREGARLARWLSEGGVAAFVLKYRLNDWDVKDDDASPRALADGLRAVRFVRASAARWGVDPARVGMAGFSAGGHLALNAGTHADAGAPAAADPVERQGSRPDFLVLVYPAVSDLDRGVTTKTPPVFLVQAADDEGTPPEDALRLWGALHRAGVPTDLHLVATGGHGFDLGKKGTASEGWPALLEGWMRQRGYLTARP